MGAQKNCPIETVLLSAHKICFGLEIRKIIFCYTLLSGGQLRHNHFQCFIMKTTWDSFKHCEVFFFFFWGGGGVILGIVKKNNNVQKGWEPHDSYMDFHSFDIGFIEHRYLCKNVSFITKLLTTFVI